MMLSHYTVADTLVPRSVPQRDHLDMKPRGLWVSVDGPDDWPWWCREEQFCHIYAQNRFRVTLAESSGTLLLSSVADLLAFEESYGGDHGLIRWPDVARKWRGIIIAPYQWTCRLSAGLWYYGWDCASGCIWDASAIASVELVAAESAV